MVTDTTSCVLLVFYCFPSQGRHQMFSEVHKALNIILVKYDGVCQ